MFWVLMSRHLNQRIRPQKIRAFQQACARTGASPQVLGRRKA